MAAFNAERTLEFAATSILRQSWQPLELIIVDDCSTDLSLRGLPVFRGLIGPMPDGKNIVRYETPDVFESVTKEWANAKPVRRRRRCPSPSRATSR